LERDYQPRELNASSRGVSKKSDRITWCSKWIAWSQKLFSKSFWDSKSQNLS